MKCCSVRICCRFNISPSSIVGTEDVKISNVSFKNIEIHYPGGGDPEYAKIGLDELDKVPEIPAKYPEFSMFKELPAWGFYIRHADKITFDNVTLVCEKEDYRPAIVLDDVQVARFTSLKVKEPGKEKQAVVSNNSKKVSVNK